MPSIQIYCALRRLDSPPPPYIKLDANLAAVGNCNITYGWVVDGTNVLDEPTLWALRVKCVVDGWRGMRDVSNPWTPRRGSWQEVFFLRADRRAEAQAVWVRRHSEMRAHAQASSWVKSASAGTVAAHVRAQEAATWHPCPANLATSLRRIVRFSGQVLGWYARVFEWRHRPRLASQCRYAAQHIREATTACSPSSLCSRES
jgi:hypothetical protein